MFNWLKSKLTKDVQAPPVGGLDVTRDILPPSTEMIPIDPLIEKSVVDSDGEQYLNIYRNPAVTAAFGQILDLHGSTENQVIPASTDNDDDQKAAGFISNQLNSGGFEQALSLMLFGYMFGKSFAEYPLKVEKDLYQVRAWKTRDFRRFMTDAAWRLRLRTDVSSDGILLNERRIWAFYAHEYHGDDGGVGLASRLYYLANMQATLQKWQSKFLESFANPPVLMFYPSNWDSMDDGGLAYKQRLTNQAKNMRNGGIMIVPYEGAAQDDKINPSEFIQFVHPQSDRNAIFLAAMEYIDKQIFRVILGQSASIEQQAGKLGNSNEQFSILQNRVKSMSDCLMDTFNEQVVKRLVDINRAAFPDITGYPKVWRVFPDVEDLNARAQRDNTLSAASGRVLNEAYLTRVYGDEYGLLFAESEPENDTQPVETDSNDKENFADDAEDPENLAAAMARDLAPYVQKDIIEVFEKALQKADSIEDLQAQLGNIFDDMPKDKLATEMGDWLAIADLAGTQADD